MSISPLDYPQPRRVPLPVSQITLNLPDDVPRSLLTTSGNRVNLGELGSTDMTMLAMARARHMVDTWHKVATARMRMEDAKLVATPPAIHQAVVARVAKSIANEDGHRWADLTDHARDRYLVDAHRHITHLLLELSRHV
ncbi:hypothetical protein [Stenotrophomonas phage StM171]|nr:hypothetical protein [Stenotrophomonas phage StM171]